MKRITSNKCKRSIEEAETLVRSDLHFPIKKFKSEFAIEQDKFILIPFLLKESLLFVSNMPRGNFA